MIWIGSAYPYPHPSCLLVHPSSLFQLGGFNPTYCFFHVFPSVYTYLCIHTYQLCNNYVTCIVAKHDVDIKYMVWCAVQNFICSCTYYTLVCTQLLTISHMIMHRHSHKQLLEHACTPHCSPFWLQWSLHHHTWTTYIDPGGLWSMWERWDFLARVWDLLTWKWYVTSCRNDFSTHGNLCEVTSWYKGC